MTCRPGVVVVALAGALAVGGCGGSSGATVDPGNKNLHVLAADPIFATLPAGATLTAPISQTPAKNRHSAFDGGAQEGPSVTATFASSQPVDTVFTFYTSSALGNGWRLHGHDGTGHPDIWLKTYPNGVGAVLTLRDTTVGRPTTPGAMHTYQLTALPDSQADSPAS